jgi:formylglycine-generating enzyme
MSAALPIVDQAAPALGELEFSVAGVIGEQTGRTPDSIRPESRLLEDLGIDSLEFVEVIMALEERFRVIIPDDFNTKMFARQPLTVSVLAEVVRAQWGTGQPERKRWFRRAGQLAEFACTPFTQLGGKASYGAEPSAGLYDAMAPTAHGHTQWRRRTDGMRCIEIPGTEVEIGSNHAGAMPDEQPLHRVRLDAFLMDAEPVSVTAYARFLNSTVGFESEVVARWCGVPRDDRRGGHFQLRQGRRHWEPIAGTEHQPMVLVSWFGAAAYSLWVNGQDWRSFNSRSLLPSEAQWEYAARGAESRRYPWGDDEPSSAHALFDLHRVRNSYEGLLPLAPVNARLGISPFDLHHMAGNVWSWCADWYEPNFYRSPASSSPNALQSKETGIRSERGGSWIGPAMLGRSSFRRGRPPCAVGRCLGFRCVGDMTRVTWNNLQQ